MGLVDHDRGRKLCSICAWDLMFYAKCTRLNAKCENQSSTIPTLIRTPYLVSPSLLLGSGLWHPYTLGFQGGMELGGTMQAGQIGIHSIVGLRVSEGRLVCADGML